MNVINKEILARMDAYIEEHRDDIITELLELVRIPSVRDAASEDAPFGVENLNMLKAVANLYESYGFKTEFDDENYYLKAYFNKKGKTLGVFAHSDVVPAGENWLICPPFEPIIKDGYIFGRGCNDDKAGIIETLYAARMIKELGLPFKNRLLMVTGANEESGMEDIIKFVSKEEMPDFSIITDGGYPFNLGEKSIIRFNVTSSAPFETIADISGGVAENVVLGQVKVKFRYSTDLAEELERLCSGNSSFEINCEDGYIYVIAKGKAAHTASVDSGINALKVLAEVLVKCDALPESDRKIFKNAYDYIGNGHGDGFGIEHNDPQFGALICSNGLVKCNNGRLCLSFDIRAGLSFAMEDIRDIIIKKCADDWSTEFTRFSFGRISDINGKFETSIVDTYKYVTGIPEAVPQIMSGGTHARYLKNAFPIGTVNYNLASPIELPEGHGGCHEPDEKLNIEGFLSAIKILASILIEADALLD